MKKEKIIKIITLALGCISLGFTQFVHVPALYGIATLFPFFFLINTRKAKDKRELRNIGILFAVFFVVRFYGFFGIPVADILLFFIAGLFIYWAFVLDHFQYKMNDGIISVFTLPLSWLTLYALAGLLRVNPALRLDFYWAETLPVAQVTSIIGSYGLTFVILLVCALFAHAVTKKTPWTAVVAVLLCGLVLGFGFYRLNSAKPEEKGTVKVAYGIGANYGDFLTYESPDDEQDFYDLAIILQDVPNDIDMFVMAEESFFFDNEENEKEFLDIVTDFAATREIYVMIPIDVKLEDGEYNRLYWIGPDGEIICSYNKRMTIPLIETLFYERGDGKIAEFTATINGQEIKIASVICFDGDFPNYLSKVSDDVDWFIIPSWDWSGVALLHKGIQSINPIENGVTTLKPTYDGYTIVVDPYGNVTTMNSTDEYGFYSVTELVVTVKSTDTVFDSIGPYLLWLCPILLFFCFASTLIGRKKNKKKT